MESSGVIFSYLSPTWTRSPSCSRSPTGTRSSEWIGIALRCDLSSPGHNRCLTLSWNISQDSNPSRSRSPSPTRSPTGTTSP